MPSQAAASHSLDQSVSSNSEQDQKKYGIKAYARIWRDTVIHNMRTAKCVDEAVYWAIILESLCGPHVRQGCYVKDAKGYIIPDRDGNPVPHDETSLLKVLNWPESKKPQIYRAIRNLKAENRIGVDDQDVWFPVSNPSLTESATDPDVPQKTYILGIVIPSHIFDGNPESVTDRVSRLEKIKEKYVTDLKSLLQQARSDLKQAILECSSLFTEEIEEIGIEEPVGRSVVEPETDTEKPELTDLQTEILEAIPQDLLSELQDTPTSKLLTEIRQKLRGAPPKPNFTERINQRRKMIKSLGALVPLADDVGKAWVRAEKARIEAVEARERAIAANYELEPPDKPVITHTCGKCGGEYAEYVSGGTAYLCRCKSERQTRT